MTEAAILEKIETLNQAVTLLQKRVEDLEDRQAANSVGTSQARIGA